MKYPKSCRIWYAAAKEATRYAMDVVKFDATASVLVATDGCGLAVVPVECEGEASDALLSLETVRAAAKNPTRFASEAVVRPHVPDDKSVTVLRRDGNLIMPQIDPTTVGNFPEYAAVIPARRNGTSDATVITLNVEILTNLAKAMGATSLRIQIDGPTTPVRLDAFDEDNRLNGCYGALMPMTAD